MPMHGIVRGKCTSPLEGSNVALDERGGVCGNACIQLEELHQQAHQSCHYCAALHHPRQAMHAIGL